MSHVKKAPEIEKDNIKAKSSVNDDDFCNNLYIRDYYIKDFNYLSPQVIEVTKRDIKDFSAFKKDEEESLPRLWFQEMLLGLRQFFYQGSLHGVKYIFEPTFNYKERVTWVVLVSISIAICAGVIIQLFYFISNNTPFVNVIDSLPTPIWAVPFPSVVLCPMLHVQLSFANVSELEGLQRFFASRICPRMFGENLYLKKRLTPAQNKKLQEFIIQGSPKCSDIVKTCHWRGANQQMKWMTQECCERYFKPIFTNYGLCYTFNGIPLNGMKNSTLEWQRSFNPEADYAPLQWNLDKGYPKVFPPDPNVLPYRIAGSGESNGLGIELFLNMSEYQAACEGSNVGFNVLIKPPTNHAYSTAVLRIPMERMTTIEVYPITYRTDTNLRTLSPKQRQCLFQNERSLQYYEFYTDKNCKHDLLVREVSRICNCVPYNWPKKRLDDPVCVTKIDFECINDVQVKVEDEQMKAYFAESDFEVPSHNWETSCHPSCNDVVYTSQLFYSNSIKKPGDKSPVWGNARKGEVTRMNVHFHDDIFLGQHRHAQYDAYYFIGTIGGLLSLFMGFSIISVAEFVYFVLLRPFNVIIKHMFVKLYEVIVIKNR